VLRLAFGRWRSEEVVTFFEQLEADNSKSFWTAHTDVYERAVKESMEALCAELDGHGFGPGAHVPAQPWRALLASHQAQPVGCGSSQDAKSGRYVGRRATIP
jgi:uncharacterized protein (DUF2461 family)